jgi:hypothetical protein
MPQETALGDMPWRFIAIHLVLEAMGFEVDRSGP